MFKKTVISTKRLFCCVRFFLRFMPLVLAVGALLFPVSAADSNRNEFVDMHEYSTYTFPEDNSEVYVDCRFPQAWIRTEVYQDNFNGPPFAVLYGSPIEFETARYGMKLQIQPVGSRLATGNPVGTQVTDAHIIDLTVVPKSTWFHSGIVIYASVNGEDDPNAIPYHGYQILYFVDKDGKVVYRDMDYMPPARGKTSDSLISFSFGSITDLASMPIPDTAVGVVPVYELHPDTNYSHSYYVEYVKFSKFRFSYNLSVLEYESQQNERLQQTMTDVKNAMDELPDKIGDEMQGVIDAEKEQSKQEGNKFVDQILDKLPDPSQGILSALGDLTSAINYTGTDATLKIPAIVLPAIGGLFPETEIWGGIEFSFSEYVEMLPSRLLTLVQSLFTIAIVLFCVYEFKGIISYCLTLREKDGG